MVSFWARLKRWTANGVIVVILALLIGDQMPLVPDRVRGWIVPVVNRLGIGQGPWSMFAPPDRVNHRLRAEITLRDGRLLTQPIADVQSLSPWQRFVGHRHSEYADNAIVTGRQYADVWDHLADHLAREHASEGGGVAQVRIIVELSPVPPPGSGPWLPRDHSFPYDDQRVVYREKYR